MTADRSDYFVILYHLYILKYKLTYEQLCTLV